MRGRVTFWGEEDDLGERKKESQRFVLIYGKVPSSRLKLEEHVKLFKFYTERRVENREKRQEVEKTEE